MMCISEAPFPQKAELRFCHRHPRVNLGYVVPGMGSQYLCGQCLIQTIADIPAMAARYGWPDDLKVDAITIQIVLDVLFQKSGLSDESLCRIVTLPETTRDPEEWPCSFGHHEHATRSEAVECARARLPKVT